MSNLLASLDHTGRRIVLGHTLNTLWHIITHTHKNSHVLSKFTILCWPHSQPSWAACGLWTSLDTNTHGLKPHSSFIEPNVCTFCQTLCGFRRYYSESPQPQTKAILWPLYPIITREADVTIQLLEPMWLFSSEVMVVGPWVMYQGCHRWNDNRNFDRIMKAEVWLEWFQGRREKTIWGPRV